MQVKQNLPSDSNLDPGPHFLTTSSSRAKWSLHRVKPSELITSISGSVSVPFDVDLDDNDSGSVLIPEEDNGMGPGEGRGSSHGS